MMKFKTTFALVLFFGTLINAQTPKIEYIAHASFVIESAKGTRVLIDPYHSYSQLGYTFPAAIQTDFILITHPHFDHDGSKSFNANTPVYRDAGIYTHNDIKFYGIKSNHGGWENMKKNGRQSYNIIWIVEIDNIKIAHLGDNDLLSAEEVSKLETVDYVIGHPEDEQLKQFSSDIVYIPNHYSLPEVSKHKNWMEPIDAWLKNKEDVKTLNSNIFEFDKKKSSRILIFKPSNEVKEWSQNYYDALARIKSGYKEFSKSKNSDTYLIALDEVISLSPNTIEGYSYKAYLLSNLKKNDQVVKILETAFLKVPDLDWSTEIRLREKLADTYKNLGKNELAYNQYLWIYRHSEITDHNTVKVAKQFIENYEN